MDGYRDKLPARILDEYKKQWDEWNHADREVPIPGLYANTPTAANVPRFLTSFSLNTLPWYTDTVRKLGYQGLVTRYNSNPDLGCSSVRRQESQVASTNSNHAHPANDQREEARRELVRAGIRSRFFREGETLLLELTADAPAFWVFCELTETRAVWSDNSLTLLPERPAVLECRPDRPLTPEEAAAQLRVTQLRDTWR